MRLPHSFERRQRALNRSPVERDVLSLLHLLLDTINKTYLSIFRTPVVRQRTFSTLIEQSRLLSLKVWYRTGGLTAVQ